MRAFIGLLRLQLKQQFRPRRGRRFGSAAVLLLPLAFIPLFMILGQFYQSITMAGAALGAPAVGIELAIMVSMLAGAMLGLTYIISSFYYSADLQLLIPLPIRPESVLYAKFVILLLNELVSVAVLYLPAMVGYSVVMRPGPSFWLLATLTMLLLPVIPLGVAALLAMGMMALTNGRVNRDALRVTLSIAFIVVWVGFQSLQRLWLADSIGGSMTPQGLAAMQRLLQSGGLLEVVGRYFPPSVWATRGILGQWQPLLLFVAATLAVACVLAAAASRLFYRGLVGGDERRAGRRSRTSEQLAAATSRASSPAVAVFWREVRQFNRTPVFLMQGLMPALMAPIYIVMPLLSRGGLAALSGIANLKNSPGTLILGVGLTQFLLSMTPIAATAFSREGGRFWMSRSLPLSGRDQMRGKLMHVMAVSGLYVLLFTLLAVLFVRPDALHVLVFIVANLLGAMILGCIGLRIDLASPRLDWTEPQQAFKGNYNSLFALLLYALVVGPIGIITGLTARASEPLGYLVGLALLAGAALLVWNEALGFADRRYDEIEL
ncbi:MAG: putative ABC transporter permease subunit [Chloroflexota bacterium]